MGYELHVQRQSDAALAEITEADWIEFVRSSPDFELRDEISSGSPGGGDEVTVRGPFGCWTGHPTVDLVPFRWAAGRITVSFADEHAVTGALAIAAALDAVVVGDDGERYDVEPRWEFDDPDAPHPEPVAAEPPRFDRPPDLDEVVFDFDGGETIWDRLLPWLRRERRR